MVPEELVQRWEIAYRQYGQASKKTAVSVPGDREAAREMALASREVAAAWRAMESTSDLPWWVFAALSAGAQAFEFQARDWNARAEHAWPVDTAMWAGPQRQLPARPQPRPRPRGEGR